MSQTIDGIDFDCYIADSSNVVLPTSPSIYGTGCFVIRALDTGECGYVNLISKRTVRGAEVTILARVEGKGISHVELRKTVIGWEHGLWKEESEQYRALPLSEPKQGLPEVNVYMWVRDETATHEMKQGLAVQISAMLAKIGGYFSLVSVVFGLVFVRKNAPHVIISMFEERTLVYAGTKKSGQLAAPDHQAAALTPPAMQSHNGEIVTYPIYPPGISQMGRSQLTE